MLSVRKRDQCAVEPTIQTIAGGIGLEVSRILGIATGHKLIVIASPIK